MVSNRFLASFQKRKKTNRSRGKTAILKRKCEQMPSTDFGFFSNIFYKNYSSIFLDVFLE